MSSNTINFFSCCNGFYKDYIPLFILSHLYYNKDAFVEVGVDEMTRPLAKALNYLYTIFPERFWSRKVSVGNIVIKDKKFKCHPGINRFVETPNIKTDYVYISDVDIICLRSGIKDIHIDDMKKTNLPYSNIVRKKDFNGKKKLTGLHFAPYENYYPIPDYRDLKGCLGNDEIFLYELIKKRFPKFNYENTFRPVHGIHMSPNRNPVNLKACNWGMHGWKSEDWLSFRKTKEFLGLEKYFTKLIRKNVKIVDGYYENKQ